MKKRKIFSYMLMGLLTLGTTAAVTSCKDYDDDIDNLQKQNDDLTKQLSTLQSALDQAKADAATAHAQYETQTDATAKYNALSTEIASLAKADQLQSAIDDINALKSGKASQEDLDALKTKIDGIDSSLNTLGTRLDNLESAQKSAQQNIDAQQKAIDQLKDQLAQKGDATELTNRLNDLKKQLDDLKSTVASASDVASLKKSMEDANTKINNINSQINILTVLINKKLTAIILKPEFYWEGLAGIEVPFANPNIYTAGGTQSFTYKVESRPVGDQDVKVTFNDDVKASGKLADISNGAVAYYHIDPSSADLSGLKLGFYTNDAEVYTRAGYDFSKFATPKETDATKAPNKFENGILQVPFKVDTKQLLSMYQAWTTDGKNEDPITDNNEWEDEENSSYGKGLKLPFIALQASKKDTTITSDYAVVTPAKIKIVALADNKPDEALDKGTFVAKDTKLIGTNHLYKTAYGTNGENYGTTLADAQTHGVVTMPATHQVVYTDTIDLRPFIETHFDYITYAKYGTAKKDQVMTDAMLASLGLHYEFTPINYTLGNEVTSESAHIQQIGDKTSGKFAPRSVTADGKTILDKQATREVVDREPIVRVDLVDEKGEIVEYGYIKLRIVAAAISDQKVTVDLGDEYLNCGAEGKMTWSQVENLILSKLGKDGLTKQEFENNYYLENVSGYENMPQINPKTKDPSGKLYTEGWQAVRYAEANESSKITDPNDVRGYGRVWYTPHDNSTDPHSWDNQTNVLVWNFYEGVKGAMTADKYKKLINYVNATYASKGASQKAISTTVRFINKNDGTSIWVTLRFGAGKLHFQYGKVEGKDLAHWFKFNQGWQPGEESDLDVYDNVPTPAEYGQDSLKTDRFDRDILEWWKNKSVILTLEGGKDHFSEFYNTNGTAKTSLAFYFTLPQKGVNSTISADATGHWVVEGVSGSKWTLELGENSDKRDNSAIYAVAQNGKAITPEKVAEIQNNGTTGYTRIHYFGTESGNNNAATDLVNKMGRRDAQFNDISTTYLNENIDRTFTAYIEIAPSEDPCYAPILANNYFNIRFQRPINVKGKNVTWTDALNNVESVDIRDLVEIKDWRDYNVLLNTTTDYSTGNVPAKFYNITDLQVIREEIRSDHELGAAARAKVLTDPAEIKKLTSVSEIPSLTAYSTDRDTKVTANRYLRVLNGNGKEVWGNDIQAGAAAPGGTWTKGARNAKGEPQFLNYGQIQYTNNGGNVQVFHIYVPIAVKYAWGNVRNNRTNESTSGVDKNLDYTQTVWAVITVDATTGHSAKRK